MKETSLPRASRAFAGYSITVPRWEVQLINTLVLSQGQSMTIVTVGHRLGKERASLCMALMSQANPRWCTTAYRAYLLELVEPLPP